MTGTIFTVEDINHTQHGYLIRNTSSLQTLKIMRNLFHMSNPAEFSYAYT